MRKFYFLIFLMLASYLPTLANPIHQSGLNNKDLWVFDETLEQCSHYSARLLGGYVNKNNIQAFLISTGQTLNLALIDSKSRESEITRYSENSFLSDYTIDRLQSEGFTSALLQCFPNSPNLRERFVINMIAGDILGKVPAIVASIYFFRASLSSMALLTRRFPLVGKIITVSTLAAIAFETTMQIRKTHLEYHLTPDEEKRVESIRKGFENGHVLRKEEINELGLETRQKLIEKIKFTQDLQKKNELQRSLIELDQNLKILNSK